MNADWLSDETEGEISTPSLTPHHRSLHLRANASQSGCDESGSLMAIYGYARVSGRDQDLTAQIDALNAAGAAKVFGEKVSGAKTDRAELAKVLKRLGEGDVLLVTRLDRLALTR